MAEMVEKKVAEKTASDIINNLNNFLDSLVGNVFRDESSVPYLVLGVNLRVYADHIGDNTTITVYDLSRNKDSWQSLNVHDLTDFVPISFRDLTEDEAHRLAIYERTYGTKEKE